MIEKVRMHIVVLACFVLLSAILTFSQQKERNRKLDSAQKDNTAESISSTDEKEKDKEEKDEGDPLFKGMKYRSIGPFRGGRSLTAAGIPGDPTTYYFGATGGGVWKSTDGANTWSPIFDKRWSPLDRQHRGSRLRSERIYVGTGEACIRGNISQGDGV